jgi:choline dehydrogenase-like flavoprotein
MCHIAGTIGTLKFTGPRDSVWNGYDIADDGTYCRRRFALRPEVQRARGIGNFVARLHHPRIPDPGHRNGILSALYLAKPIIPYEYRMRLHGSEAGSLGQWLRHAGNVVTDLPATIGFLAHLLRDRRLAERKYPSIVIRSKSNYFSLDFHAEQAPDPDSRVVLTGETDALGMPRLEARWRYGAEDVATVSRSLALLAHDIERSGTGSFVYDPDSVEQEMTRYGAYGGHHIGTARMGGDPSVSVVDSDCRVHGIDNLYVAGSAVFPTSSQANPTLTAVALALRLAGHLKGERP